MNSNRVNDALSHMGLLPCEAAVTLAEHYLAVAQDVGASYEAVFTALAAAFASVALNYPPGSGQPADHLQRLAAYLQSRSGQPMPQVH